MQLSLDCIACSVNSIQRLLKTDIIPEKDKEPLMRKLLAFLAETDYTLSPPVMGREMHRMIRQQLNIPDPYKDIKEKYNRMMLEHYTEFEKMVHDAKNPFDTAMRLAIAGNVIDFGARRQLDITETIHRVMNARFAIDDSRQLQRDLRKAHTVLYIGDNCGEIVLDKLFLNYLHVPELYFAVRGGPIINDVTIKDAQLVGIDQLAKVISTGDDSPGVVWETSSEEFKQVFNKADVIISKGQGNLEGLIDIPQNIYFLLVVKCALIGSRLGVKEGQFVVKRTPLRS